MFEVNNNNRSNTTIDLGYVHTRENTHTKGEIERERDTHTDIQLHIHRTTDPHAHMYAIYLSIVDALFDTCIKQNVCTLAKIYFIFPPIKNHSLEMTAT